MVKDIGVVLPALEKNRYSPLGDLVKFGGSTLLEWKITQLLKVVEKNSIYVSTPSGKIQDMAKAHGVNIIRRKPGSGIQDMMDTSIKEVRTGHILWTNATSPFLGPRHYDSMIKAYLGLDEKKYDSIIAVLRMREYIMYKDKPLNFDIRTSQIRSDIEPVFKVTNACSIAKREVCLKYKKDFGICPFLYEVDKFASMEISEIDDDSMLNDLVAHYFRQDLDIVEKELWQR